MDSTHKNGKQHTNKQTNFLFIPSSVPYLGTCCKCHQDYLQYLIKFCFAVHWCKNDDIVSRMAQFRKSSRRKKWPLYLSHGEKLQSEQNFDVILCTNDKLAISMKKAIQTTASNLQQTALDNTVTPFCRSHGPSTLFFSFTSTRHVIQWIFDNSEEHIHFLQSSQDPLGKLVPMLILHTFEHNVWINIWENLSPHTGNFFFPEVNRCQSWFSQIQDGNAFKKINALFFFSHQFPNTVN